MNFPLTPSRSTALLNSSTPHTQGSGQKTDQNSSKRLASSVDHALERELQNAPFLDYPLQSFSKSFLRQSLELADTENMEDINWEEKAFFEKIGNVCNGILSKPNHGLQSRRRQFFFQGTRTLAGSDPDCFKPDAGICSLSENKESLCSNNVNWHDVCLVCEHTRSSVTEVRFLRKLRQLVRYARTVMTERADCRFLHGLLFIKPNAWLLYFDRVGVHASIGFNLGQSMTFFCKVVACYRDLTDVQIGYDPAFLHSESGPNKLLITNHALTHAYHIHALIFQKKALISRGTRVFAAFSAGSDKQPGPEKPNVIIKDFWAPATSNYGEVDLLKAAAEAGVRGISKLLSGMQILIDGEKDVTAANPESYPRVHMRITTASIGVPIRDVVTGEDSAVCLSEIIRDAMLSHYELWKIAGILHCGMSSAFGLYLNALY